MEELLNFTISFEQNLAMFWPAKAMNPNENDSNELRCEILKKRGRHSCDSYTSLMLSNLPQLDRHMNHEPMNHEP